MPPNNRFRLFFFKIQNNPFFEKFIFGCITLNTVILMLKWYQQDERIVMALELLNYIFTGIFALEVIIKIVG